MGRRKSGGDEGMNLDSLMDALTNVVAVLILVLLLVQADVTQKVVELLEDLEPATPEEVAQNQETLRKLEEEMKDKMAQLKETPPTPEEINAEKRRLALLEKKIQQEETSRADIEELKKLEVKAREKRDAEQAETVALQEEIERLEALLDETPVLAALPPAEVTIPNSRPIPDNAEIYYALVNGDRVHFIDPFSPQEEFLDEVKDHRNDWLFERVKQKGADRYIYDQTKIGDYFKKFQFKNARKQKISLLLKPESTVAALTIAPDLKEGGTTETQLREKKNLFGDIMRKLGSNKKAVIFFKVNPNAFNTYLTARKLADFHRVPAGWSVEGASSHWFKVADLEVNRLKEPPVRTKKPSTGPPKIGPKLD